MVRDGEGAQKLIEIEVTGAVSDKSAKRVAMAIANSPLVKTAIAGEDANWGRIVMAVGKSGEPADRDQLSVAVGGTWMARDGAVVPGYDEAPVVAHMRGREIAIEVDLGLGKGTGRVGPATSPTATSTSTAATAVDAGDALDRHVIDAESPRGQLRRTLEPAMTPTLTFLDRFTPIQTERLLLRPLRPTTRRRAPAGQ